MHLYVRVPSIRSLFVLSIQLHDRFKNVPPPCGNNQARDSDSSGKLHTNSFPHCAREFGEDGHSCTESFLPREADQDRNGFDDPMDCMVDLVTSNG